MTTQTLDSSRSQRIHRVIRASAGSGKTYQLAVCYLSLLGAGAEPRSILATTFTRKAAAEILERILSRLAEAAQDPDKAKALERDLEIGPVGVVRALGMLRELCDSIHRLSVSTIDSFFNRVAQSFRFELGIPSGVRVIDPASSEAAQLRAQAINAMLMDEPPDAMLRLLRRLHHDEARSSVTESIDKIVSSRHELFQQASDRKTWERVKVPRTLLNETKLAQAIAALGAMERHLPLTAKGEPRFNWARAWAKLNELAMQRDFKALLSHTLVDRMLKGEEMFDRIAIPQAWSDVLMPLAQHAQADYLRYIAMQTEATYDLLASYDRHLSALKSSSGVIYFSDLSTKLARGLDELGPEVIDELYYRLDAAVLHLMLDEFQDTSLQQWSVLKPLASEVTAHRDGSRRFFCVGDTKQAIYGWRGGCPELFDRLRSDLNLVDDDFEDLFTSRRSSQVVLDAVNQVFSSIGSNATFSEPSDVVLAQAWQSTFEPHVEARSSGAAGKPGFVELVTTDSRDQELPPQGDDAEAAEWEPPTHRVHAARQIAAIAGASPGASVGVLVPTNLEVTRLIQLLRDLGVNASGEGGTALTDDAGVSVILSAMTMADHPGHTAAVHHVWHSALARAVGLRSDSPEHAAAASLRIRRELLTRGYGQTVGRWVGVLSAQSDARGCQRLSQLIGVADAHDAMATLRPRDFVARVNATAVEEPTPARVRVMTIYRSKGLEFDIVVLPHLHKTLLRSSAGGETCAVRDGATGPIAGVYCGVNKLAQSLCADIEEAALAHRNAELRDDLCALYVAMTRARYALHMMLPAPKLTKSNELGSRGLSFAAILLSALVEGAEPGEGGQVLYEAGDRNWHRTIPEMSSAQGERHEPASVLRASVRKSAAGADGTGGLGGARSWRTASPSSMEAGGRIDVADLLRLSPAVQRVRGTIIHEWFALIDWLRDEHDDGPGDEELLRAAKRAAPECDEAAAIALLPEFRRMLAQRAVRDVLTHGRGDVEPELWRERAFAVRVEGKLLQGRFDRVVIERGQNSGDARANTTVATLIDFKTDRVVPGGVGPIVERYEPQIRAYKAALSRLLGANGVTVRAGLLLVGAGVWCDV